MVNANLANIDGPGGGLGSAGATNFFGVAGAFRPAAMIPLFTGSDPNPGSADINMNIDTSENWYFGTDGNPAFNQIDLITVILHEVSHGLGYVANLLPFAPACA